MSAFYSEIYHGYTITLINSEWRIAGVPHVQFLSLAAAKRYIDKLES
ncbi:MAG: hypothetical protein ACT4OJ_14195 [Bacteroidota bacterium]